MIKHKAAIGQDRFKWRVGQRVSRKNTDEHGTIYEADGQIAVKWDDGRTSYFDRKTPVNVELLPTK